MRPEAAHQYITNSIQKLLHGKPINKKKMLIAIEKLLEKYYVRISEWESKEEIEKQKIVDMQFDESYGIHPNSYGTLSYISDRFNCGFRLCWLREMVRLDMFNGRGYYV